jgi:hypothetical protein
MPFGKNLGLSLVVVGCVGDDVAVINNEITMFDVVDRYPAFSGETQYKN